ncbi:MAG: Protein kinase [Labilithrix sp.]|nr:Protein kinase [Labilithrix sp.]
MLTAAAGVQRAPVTGASSYEIAAGATLAGRYVLEHPIGEGAMGVVWRATQRASGEPVAIKLLKGFARDARHRFLREARLAAALVHPGLVRVVEVLPDVEAGCPALVMELLTGESLAARLAAGPLDGTVTATIAGRVATTLAYVHGAGTVHRDVKPANVFLVGGHPGSAVKLLDLGLARSFAEVPMDAALASRITRTGEAVGSPAYMAPEQLGGARADAAGDAWSLAVTLHECLTGALPFVAATPAALLRAIRTQGTRAAAARLRGLGPLVELLLSLDPAQRPSLGAVAEALAPEV